MSDQAQPSQTVAADPPLPAPEVEILACDLLANGSLRLCGYDHASGRAFRMGLVREAGEAWRPDGKPRFVGTGGPYSRQDVEARAEAAGLAWASRREDAIEDARHTNRDDALSRPRQADETKLRRARANRRHAEVLDKGASNHASHLREKVGRTLGGFPVAFAMTHKGVAHAVRVSGTDPLLRIEGGGSTVLVDWDGTVPGPDGRELPSAETRSLALQCARRRQDLLLPLSKLLKARWDAMSQRAEADRLEAAASHGHAPDRPVAVEVPPPAVPYGWGAVAYHSGEGLQVCFHDLAEARQILVLVEPDGAGGLRTHPDLVSLPFRTGRREEIRDDALSAEALRLAREFVGRIPSGIPSQEPEESRDAPVPDAPPRDAAPETVPVVPLAVQGVPAPGADRGPGTPELSHATSRDPAAAPAPPSASDAGHPPLRPPFDRPVEEAEGTSPPRLPETGTLAEDDEGASFPDRVSDDVARDDDEDVPEDDDVFEDEGEAQAAGYVDDPEIDGYVLERDELPEDDVAALALLLATSKPAAAPASRPPDPQADRLREIVARAERLRAEGRPYPSFPYEEEAETEQTRRLVRLKVRIKPDVSVSIAYPTSFEGTRVTVECYYSLTGLPRKSAPHNETLLDMIDKGPAYRQWADQFIGEADAMARERIAEGDLGVAIRGEAARIILADRQAGRAA